jgi:hypothetical protein
MPAVAARSKRRVQPLSVGVARHSPPNAFRQLVETNPDLAL